MSDNIIKFKKKKDSKPMIALLGDIFLFILWLITGIITLIGEPTKIAYACILIMYLFRKLMDIIMDIMDIEI